MNTVTDPEMDTETDAKATTEAKTDTETDTKTDAETNEKTVAKTDTKLTRILPFDLRLKTNTPLNGGGLPERQVESVYIEQE